MTIRNYSFYEGSRLVDSINVEYEATGIKEKIRRVYNLAANAIDLGQIWVNDICVQHLKGFSSAILPENFESSIQHRKIGENYYLDFEEVWDWFPKATKINIQYEFQGAKDWVKNVLVYQKVMGLKKLIEQKIGDLSEGEYCLYFRNWPLQDKTVIEDLGICDEDVIEIVIQADLQEGPTSLQWATGGSYISIQMFENYFQQMEEKLKLVCQISTPTFEGKANFGSGFLIDQHLIMTNYHVVQTGLVNAKAKFLYHQENDQDLVEVDIHRELVCFSPTPEGEFRDASSTHLDYAILSLKPSQNMSLKQYESFCKLGSIAKIFFQNAKNEFDGKLPQRSLPIAVRIEKEKKQFRRANIIQHPLKKIDAKNSVSQPKQIAFRHNRIHQGGQILHYHTPTDPAASGSPVINDSGELIGLHYAHCFGVDKLLYKHVIMLCEKLGYHLKETKPTAYYFVKGEKPLYIFRTNVSKGSCSNTVNGAEKFSLRALILNDCPELKTKQNGLSRYILDFLHSQKESIKEDHFYCNKAINIEEIFRDLKNEIKGEESSQESKEKETKKKQQLMDQAIENTKIVWDNYLSTQKNKVRIENLKKGGRFAIVALGTLGLGYIIYKFKDSIMDLFKGFIVDSSLKDTFGPRQSSRA